MHVPFLLLSFALPFSHPPKAGRLSEHQTLSIGWLLLYHVITLMIVAGMRVFWGHLTI